ncbi:MAG: O-antigen ligase family protein, partial [Acidobacteriota bacterium]|nr:O-antigen ligase family protein [Acidobacteriota bacterium]
GGGGVVVILLPALYLLPAAVVRCWRSDGDRRRGGAALAAVVTVLAAWALWGRFGLATERAALPLGHHLPTAAWLALLLPLAVLGVRRPGPGRWLAGSAAILGTAALALTRSVLGGAALGLVLLLAAVALGRARKNDRTSGLSRGLLWPLTVGAVAVALAPLVPRWAGLSGGDDSSLLARQTYWQAGWEGALARPWLGWGPGSTPWTVGRFLRPEPGINPPGEIVSDLHSLPLQIFYELGLGALVLAVAVVVLLLGQRLLRRGEGQRSSGGGGEDAPWTAAAALGLVGFAVVSSGGAFFGASALPVALAVVVGALVAAAPQPRPPSFSSPAQSRGERWRRPVTVGAYLVYVFAAAVALTPLLLAQRSYERAAAPEVAEDGDVQYYEVGRAVALDPDFPLYRSIFGQLDEDPEQQRTAAESAQGVGYLWLEAGLGARRGGAPWALEALRQACALLPLSGLPAFRALDLETDEELAVQLAARALAADPNLAASPRWRDRPEQRRRAVERLQSWEGIDAGWRLALSLQVAELPEGGSPGPVETVDLRLDGGLGMTFSELVFRRSPWPADYDRVELERHLLARLSLPPASRLPTTAAEVFAPEGCFPPARE